MLNPDPELMKMDIREPARATIDLTLDADESTSVDLPSVADVTMVVRGELANRVGLVSCEKLKQMLGWRPVYTWQKMAAESEKLGFSNSPPT